MAGLELHCVPRSPVLARSHTHGRITVPTSSRLYTWIVSKSAHVCRYIRIRLHSSTGQSGSAHVLTGRPPVGKLAPRWCARRASMHEPEEHVSVENKSVEIKSVEAGRSGPSRRGFLKGVGAGLTGLAVSGPVLSAC